MIEIILIRPGQTDWRAAGRLAGNAPLPLNKVGLAQCEELAASLADEGLAALYCGGDQSTVETGKALSARLGGRLRTMQDLREVNCGLWQGLSAETLKARHPKAHRQWMEEPLSVSPPEGESPAHAVQRIRRGLLKIGRKWAGKKVGAIMGEVAMGLAYCMLHDEPGAKLWEVADADVRVYRCLLDQQPLEIR